MSHGPTPATRAGLAAILAALGVLAARSAQGDGAVAEDPGPLLGEGPHTYRWVRGWARLPEGVSLGNTHGCVVVDARDRVYVNTDTESAVLVFAPSGELLDSWGAELAGGLHGMTLVEEDGEEFLYLAHKGRHEILKTTLEGRVLWRAGWPEESGIYPGPRRYRPTSLAVAGDGDVYVADGYGASWIHHYDAEGTYLSSWGGPGREAGKLRIPHGIELLDDESLLVSDRMNRRLQRFDQEGGLLGVVDRGLRRPCHTETRDGRTLVADLDGRVTVLGPEGEVVVHLGENHDPEQRGRNATPSSLWRDGVFVAPHCVASDSRGDLYVVDWVAEGRITKLEHVER